MRWQLTILGGNDSQRVGNQRDRVHVWKARTRRVYGEVMHRRGGGLLIILIVVIVAVVAPAVLGRRVSGSAVAVPVPDPPRAGACLVTPVTNGSASPVMIAPCSADRFGEVVMVTDDPRTLAATSRRQGDDDGTAVSDERERQACGDQVLRYLGLTVNADHEGFMQSYWQPLAPLDMSISRPSVRQVAAGQHWMACSFYVHDYTGKAASYRNSAKDAYGLGKGRDGVPPAALAYCLTTDNLLTAESVPCPQPHTAEAFAGIRTARPGLTAESLHAGCAVLAARLTRMTDTTAGGALHVAVSAVHGPTGTGEPGLGGSGDVTGYAVCVISAPAGRALAGSLLALADRPVPWSS